MTAAGWSPSSHSFTYLLDADHGWLMVTNADLVAAGMSSADFTSSSYVLEHLFALEEDCDMLRFLKRLDGRAIPYRLREHHFEGDAYCRYWDHNSRR